MFDMLTTVDIFVGISIVIVVVLIAFYFFIYGNVSQVFQNKIEQALYHWSQTDDKLADMSESWLETMYEEVEDILCYPETLYNETGEKLNNLADRLAFILYAEQQQEEEEITD